MQQLLTWPGVKPQRISPPNTTAQDAIWIIDLLASELAANGSLDGEALLGALQQHAGYEEADPLWADDIQARRAELVARLAGRLARG